MKRIALGKGLGALLPEDKTDNVREILEIETASIKPNRLQPRTIFDDAKIKELAESIKSRGLIQPVVVRRNNDYYELIVGERRLRAVNLLKLETIPAIIYDDISNQDIMVMALIENIQRENLNPVDEAEAFRVLLREYSITQEELASKIGKERSSISNSLRLLTLPEKVRHYIVEGKLSAGAARVILAVPGDKEKIELAEKAIRECYSVRELERQVYGDSQKRSLRRKTTKSPHLLSIEDRLKRKLQTKVSITTRKKGGRIIIEYYNNDGLTRILEELNITESL